jgi:hypothetical protein
MLPEFSYYLEDGLCEKTINDKERIMACRAYEKEHGIGSLERDGVYEKFKNQYKNEIENPYSSGPR